MMIDAYDSQKAKLGSALKVLHGQLEVQRASGALDANTFISALTQFDPSLAETTAAAIYIDCEMAGDGSLSLNEPVPLRKFVELCEAHGCSNVQRSAMPRMSVAAADFALVGGDAGRAVEL